MNKLVVANWKMKLSPHRARAVATALRDSLKGRETRCAVAVAPDFLSLQEVGAVFKSTDVALVAQDCFWEHEGAFTGEVSADYCKELGCSYCILGHSERREHMGETDEMVHRKLGAALEAGLTPIVCVGENFAERQAGQKEYVILRQVTKALEGTALRQDQKIVVAYEPVWVIGSGQAIEPAEAEHTHRAIHQVLVDLFDTQVASRQFSIIYGGSVDKDDVTGFIQQSAVQGVLVGSASIDPDHFASIITAVSQA